MRYRIVGGNCPCILPGGTVAEPDVPIEDADRLERLAHMLCGHQITKVTYHGSLKDDIEGVHRELQELVLDLEDGTRFWIGWDSDFDTYNLAIAPIPVGGAGPPEHRGGVVTHHAPWPEWVGKTITYAHLHWWGTPRTGYAPQTLELHAGAHQRLFITCGWVSEEGDFFPGEAAINIVFSKDLAARFGISPLD